MLRVNYLVSDELDWELLTRNVDPSNYKVDEKRKLLRTKLNIEKCDPSKTSSYTYVELDVGQELELCNSKLSELFICIESFEKKPLTPEFNRLESKLQHVYRRLDYIADLVQDEIKTSWQVGKDRCLELLESLSEVGESDIMHQNDLISILEQSQRQLGNSNINDEVVHASFSGDTVTQALVHAAQGSSSNIPSTATLPDNINQPLASDTNMPVINRITSEDVLRASLATATQVTSSVQQPRLSLANIMHSSPNLPSKKVDFDTYTAADRFASRLRDLDLSHGLNCISPSMSRPVSVSKWNLKFSGITATQGVNSF